MKTSSSRTSNIIILVLLILCLLNLAALSIVLRPGGLTAAKSEGLIIPTSTNTLPVKPSEIPSVTLEITSPQPSPTQTYEPTVPLTSLEGLSATGGVFLSMADGWNSHLFAYNPQYLTLTRLTDNHWDDIHPALSPDGTHLAFTSKANGYWDLFLMDLHNGSLTRLTDTGAYDGHPTWSPDGQWLAYETYINDHFEIFLLSVSNPSDPPIHLAGGPDSSHSPAWSPQGRQIAFVSNRYGDDDIWLAALDQVENRFTNLSNSLEIQQSNPAWSPDGQNLAWVDDSETSQIIMICSLANNPAKLRSLSTGNYPVWSEDGNSILALVSFANQNGIVTYEVTTGNIQQPLMNLPGTVSGLDWKSHFSTEAATTLLQYLTNQRSNGIIVHTQIAIDPAPPAGRFGVVPLDDVQTTYPYLSDAVDESFNVLRSLAARETGWDVLATLENAYLPLTSPLQPGGLDEWLYTGRGIALSSAPFTAGWMVIRREDIAGQTYWRVFLKTRFQDGSQGMPLPTTIWDLSARYVGDPQSYEQGGAIAVAPAGYWVDFTELALRAGWERLPAQMNWRTYFPATRFNMFINTGGQNWYAAMEQIYPTEALVTPTGYAPLLPTATATPVWSLVKSPTSQTTRRPTWTPSP